MNKKIRVIGKTGIRTITAYVEDKINGLGIYYTIATKNDIIYRVAYRDYDGAVFTRF